MRIVRYVDRNGRTHHGSEEPQRVRRIEGDLLGAHRLTDETADVARRLAPL